MNQYKKCGLCGTLVDDGGIIFHGKELIWACVDCDDVRRYEYWNLSIQNRISVPTPIEEFIRRFICENEKSRQALLWGKWEEDRSSNAPLERGELQTPTPLDNAEVHDQEKERCQRTSRSLD